MKLRKLTLTAVLTAAALVMFVLESQLPPLTAIPGIKMGLANIITVFAVFTLGPGDAAMILLARILLGAVIAGNPSTLMYSAAGGAMCLLIMLPLKRILTRRQVWVASVFGAAAHNTAQLLLAALITGTGALMAYLPVLLLSGMTAGLFTGLCAQALMNHHIFGGDGHENASGHH